MVGSEVYGLPDVCEVDEASEQGVRAVVVEVGMNDVDVIAVPEPKKVNVVRDCFVLKL